MRTLSLNPPSVFRVDSLARVHDARCAPGAQRPTSPTYPVLDRRCTALKGRVEDLAGVLNGAMRTLDTPNAPFEAWPPS